MTVHRVERNTTWFSFLCDGCGLRWRRRLWDGPPPGWRRYRAGDDQADLCRECQAIGVWIDHPEAMNLEAFWRPGFASRDGKTARMNEQAQRQYDLGRRVLTVLARPPRPSRDGIVCPVCRHLMHDGYGFKSGRCLRKGGCACVRAYLPSAEPAIENMPLHGAEIRFR